MNYIKNVNKNSIEFEPLVRMIGETRSKSYRDPVETIKEKIKEKHGIILGDFNRKKGYTPVDFVDEGKYILFLLEWV